MPKLTDDSLKKILIEASETMPDKVAPKAYRNKMQGYKLWKEAVAEIQLFEWGGGKGHQFSESGEMPLFDVFC